MTSNLFDRNFEVDKIKYQESITRSVHISRQFYITVALFITIVTSSIINPSLLKKPLPALIIGTFFLLLVIRQTKFSRILGDNQDLIEEFRSDYPTKINYNGTGIVGLADFIDYAILIVITSFYLLMPIGLSLNKPDLISLIVFASLAPILLLLIYYIMARGDLIIGKNNVVRNRVCQNILLCAISVFYLAYVIILFCFFNLFKAV